MKSNRRVFCQCDMDSLPRLSDQYSAQGKSYSAKDYFAFDTGSIYLRCDMPLIFQIYFQYYVVAVLTDNFVINRNNGIGSLFFSNHSNIILQFITRFLYYVSNLALIASYFSFLTRHNRGTNKMCSSETDSGDQC